MHYHHLFAFLCQSQKEILQFQTFKVIISCILLFPKMVPPVQFKLFGAKIHNRDQRQLFPAAQNSYSWNFK